ncbi:hypothetical protein THASP1DRAFT_28769 [Thamnocephalis sphaerospora]|uniref:Proteasome assembly chaperone 2 n=1 Tax=Thamnocephalis sphaerospora TaxID=78915 RepID=A0A4P9XTG8_9FUNG|nr:hypothetical protein THASP1DRAFT_28769 [Thamnocephalis sphaerospora]|eukprot:RKP09457.1 hypothetical protein THASP1DRAFT_28769 [Thamnocephalis sphaerospora]
MNTFTPTAKGSPSFKEAWLVIPTVSTGGVSQLAVDLIISTLQLKRVGYLNDPNVLPVACVDPCGTGEKGIATALEGAQTDGFGAAVDAHPLTAISLRMPQFFSQRMQASQ